MSIEVKGLKSITDNFGSASNSVKSELNDAINRAGITIQRSGRIESPIKTGNLRSQIRFKNTMNGRGVVGSYAQYSVYVHEGTKHMRSNPFMERAVDSSKPMLDLIFNKAVANISKHLMKGK